jgi:signal transduction histidine kinase
LHVSEFSIAGLCRDLIDFVRPLADKRNQTLEARLADDLPHCRSDSGKIKQILYNLLSNAVKFTPTGGAISLSADRDGDRYVRLVVLDNGPGIAESQRQAIFEKFHQLDSSQTREHAGTGLGLAIQGSGSDAGRIHRTGSTEGERVVYRQASDPNRAGHGRPLI